MTGVLDGVRVVELGQVLAGPFAGAIFADLGADVIKVEKPDGGDDARRMGPDFRHGDALNFHEFNRGKKSVTLDLKSPEGVEALHGLLAGADIMLHNLRPGAADALGIGAQAVTARHPHLIYCEMSAFGHVGPEKLRPGYEPLLQAFGGLSSITGEPDGPPVRMGASVVDQGTGLWTVLGALAMLERRHRTGLGGVVNTSLFETALLWAGQKISAYVNMGKLPERHASGHPNLTPYEAFDAADGPVLVCCGNDRLFAKFAAELGHAEWASDERFSTNRARLKHKALLLPMIAALMRITPRGRPPPPAPNGWRAYHALACPARQ
jgi:formyl-CoA transferase